MTEHRTETQALEDRIVEALTTIRRDHQLILPLRPGAARLGSFGQASLYKHADLDERSDDIDALTRRVDDDLHVTVMVNGWVRLVVEDAHVSETTPNGSDVADMCTFLERWARWASGHEAAPDMADELEGLVGVIRQWVPEQMRHEDYRPQPIRRLIGRCTEEIEQDDRVQACDGRVYAYPDGDGTEVDEHDGDDPWATCERCGSRAVVSVWQQWMFPEVAEEVETTQAEKIRDRALTVQEVLNLAHREFGKPATKQALWHWVSRGQIRPIDPDAKPHTFRLGDVVELLSAKVG